MHLYKMPPGSIVELSVGIRAETASAEALVRQGQAQAENQQLKAYECTLNTSTLSVGFQDYRSLGEIVE